MTKVGATPINHVALVTLLTLATLLSAWPATAVATYTPPNVEVEDWPQFQRGPQHQGSVVDTEEIYTPSGELIAEVHLGPENLTTPISTPAFAEGKVLVTAGDITQVPEVSGTSQLYAINPESFEVEWSTPLDERGSSPVVYDGTVFVYTTNATLYAINLEDGSVLWSKNTVGGLDLGREPVTPVVGEKAVVVGGGASGGFEAFSREHGIRLYEANADNRVNSGPMLLDDFPDEFRALYAGGYWGLMKINPDDGSTEWEEVRASTDTRYPAEPTYVPPRYAGSLEVVGVGERGIPYAVDSDTGEVEWRNETVTGGSFQAPITAADSGLLLFSAEGGHLWGLAGEEVKLVLNGSGGGSPALADWWWYQAAYRAGQFSNSIDAYRIQSVQGHRYVGDYWSFPPEDQRRNWTDAGKHPVTSPIFINGTLFVGGHGTLLALDAGSGAPAEPITQTLPPEPEMEVQVDGLRVTMDASGSSDPDDEIIRYEWDWSHVGGGDVTGATAEITFEEPGTKRIYLSVTDEAGHVVPLRWTGNVTAPQDAQGADGSEDPAAGDGVDTDPSMNGTSETQDQPFAGSVLLIVAGFGAALLRARRDR